MKPLIVFDIDGTLIDTIKVDDYCYIQTYKDLFQINLCKAEWNNFTYVTDWGITNQIFEETFKRLPTTTEVDSIKDHFLTLLEKESKTNANNFSEIPGAVDFINDLREKRYPLAIATGGWEETALFKLKKIGLKLNGISFANSNHHYSRSKITQNAIDLAKKMYSTDFEKIIYFGDGQWDLLNCRKMGIEFIGIDYYGTGKLKELGAEFVVRDFSQKAEIFGLLKKTMKMK